MSGRSSKSDENRRHTPNKRGSDHRRPSPAPKLVRPHNPVLAAMPEEVAQALPETPPEVVRTRAVELAPEPAPHPIDVDKLAENTTKIVEAGGKILSTLAAGGGANAAILSAEQAGDMARTIGRALEPWFIHPERLMEQQAAWTGKMIDLWANTLDRFMGKTTEPLLPPERGDKRYADPTWHESPFFDFLRQAHTITTRWMNDLIAKSEADARVKAKADFYLRQIASATSPSNFIFTNPELMRVTLNSDGGNLVRGLAMLADDLAAGKGQLRLRQSDASQLELGRDMASTPGKVIFRNELIELIQYAPATAQVYERPVLVVPPWINKFYILDLNPKKSYVRWMVEQGLTVFMISWVNPDARHAEKGFADYMHGGVLAAIGAIEKAIGVREVSAIGYCVGGTMLSATLAWMAAKGDARVANATLFASQADFSEPGELAVFTDAESIAALEKRMEEAGYLDGAMMANAFNMLRPDDLIWSYVVNNYMRGQEPAAFDLLTWNSDSTRMTRACHSYYLRECYLENNLSQGRMVLDGETLDLGKITIPVYSLATREDHIAPARSVYRGMRYFGGPVRYVLGGSGHIAGVVNPPSLGKYSYWTNGALDVAFEDWVARASETKGSWWPDWVQWLTDQAPAKVPARQPGEGGLPALGDAPGDYVRVKS